MLSVLVLPVMTALAFNVTGADPRLRLVVPTKVKLPPMAMPPLFVMAAKVSEPPEVLSILPPLMVKFLPLAKSWNAKEDWAEAKFNRPFSSVKPPL